MADRRKGGLSRARGGPRPWARYRKWARGSTAFNRKTDFLTACEAAVKDKTFDINGRYSLSIEIVVSSSESQEIFVLVPEISMWRWRIFFYFLFLLFFQLLEFSSKKFDEKFDFTRERNRRRRRGRERENPATILFPEIISIGNFREEYSWSYAFTAGSDVFDPYKSIARNEWKFSWNPSVGSGQTCYLSLWNRFTRACTRHRKRIRARPTRREI